MEIFKPYTYTMEALIHRANALIPDAGDPKRQEQLREVLSFIDLTTLAGDDTEVRVAGLCNQGIRFGKSEKGTKAVAAICVYPVFAEQVHQALEGTGIKTACVAGAFPSGQSPLGLRVDEVAYAVEMGADEIDMVISRGRLIEGDEDFTFQEIEAIKAACGTAHLKVILETGELRSVELIRRASEIALLAGADFLKTSTGKIQPAATPEAFLIMLDSIREYYVATGKVVGIKPAGGIATPADALHYYAMVNEVLGADWLNASRFRIGASRLATEIYNEIF